MAGKKDGRGGKSKMGRQKIEIKKITNEEARQVCFSKRRHGLIKKAGELCILCGSEVAIIVFSPAGKAFSYGDPSVDSIINRFRDPSSFVPGPPDAHRLATVHELNSQHEKLVQQIEMEKKRRLELEKQQRSEARGHTGRFWDADVDSLSPEQLEEFKGALEEMRSALAKRTDELMMGMAMMHLPSTVHHHQFIPPSLAPPASYASNSSFPPLPSNSFLSGYNTNSMIIPFTNNSNAFMGASSRQETMPNSGDYFVNNQFAGRPFYRL